MATLVLTLRTPSQALARVPVRDGDTIDAALDRAGYIRPRRGCRRGGCGQCAATLIDGKVVDQRPIAESVLPPARRQAGAILLCRSVPVTDVLVAVAEGQVRCVSPLQRTLAERALADRLPSPTPERT